MTDTHSPLTRLDPRYRFLDRHKTLAARPDIQRLATAIRQALASAQTDQVLALLHGEYPADLADAMFFLNDTEDKAIFDLLGAAEAAEVLDEVDAETTKHLVAGALPQRLATILGELLPDDATDILGKMERSAREQVLTLLSTDQAEAIRALLAYPKESAGGIMTSCFVAVPETATQAEAVQAFVNEPMPNTSFISM